MKMVNIIGLGLNIVGVIIIFFFGLPPGIDRDGYIRIVAEQIDEEEKKKAKIYDRLAMLAITLIGIGFILQLASNFL